MRLKITIVVLGVTVFLGSSPGCGRSLWPFQPEDPLRNIHTSHAAISLIKQSSVSGTYGIRIEFEAAARPQAEFTVVSGQNDWRSFGALAVQVSNPSNKPIGFSIEVTDAAGADTKGLTQSDLEPHQTATFALAINSPWPADLGMRGEPPIPGVRRLVEDHKRVDLEHVTRFRVLPSNPEEPHSLVIDDIKLLPGVSYDAIVDSFGQFSRGDWPGKVKDGADLRGQRQEEEAELQAHPILPDRDEYGGWASGPQLEATGYFRTQKADGKWWLVTPSGHLFFSLGMDVVYVGDGATVIEGREYMFHSLPTTESPLASHYSISRIAAPIGLKIKFIDGRTFDFYAANLERKYGADWLNLWTSTATARLQAWGFNTIGNWSDRKIYKQHRIPYTATLKVIGPVAEIPGGGDFWSRMLDPFDPAFTEAAIRAAQADVGCRGDPWCVGYFVDNELSWGTDKKDERSRYGLALGALSLGADSPAKRAFVDRLEKKYKSIGKFNEAWNTHFADWPQVIAADVRPDYNFTDAMREDMTVFLRALAGRYFQIIRDALRQSDPNHLYLGSRFYFYTPESLDACEAFCDVVSFNIYEPKIEPTEWSFLSHLKKPVIIGEFHMGSTDRGMFHPGLVSAPSQSARAEMFKEYVRSVLDNPMFVGCHYFKYNDEPLTGRPMDGENYAIGFTNVVDGVYPEMVEAAKAVSSEMYERRAHEGPH
jgi:hypothetical protein